MGPEEGALVIVALFCDFRVAVQVENMADFLLGLLAVEAQHTLSAFELQNGMQRRRHHPQIVIPGGHDKSLAIQSTCVT